MYIVEYKGKDLWRLEAGIPNQIAVVIMPPPGVGVIGSWPDNIGGRFRPILAGRKGALEPGGSGFWVPSGVI